MTAIYLWAKELDDGKPHHIGEYYEYRYKKPWRKKDGTDTSGFRNWMLQQNTNAIGDILKRDFEILRDNLSCGFIIQRKKPVHAIELPEKKIDCPYCGTTNTFPEYRITRYCSECGNLYFRKVVNRVETTNFECLPLER